MPKPPSQHQSLSPTRRFELRVRPEQPGLAWSATLEGAQCATLEGAQCATLEGAQSATLEGAQSATLEFSSPLELARFLADLSGDAPEDTRVPVTPTGLR